MMETYTTPAISLGRRPWRDNDLLINFYLPGRGKVELIARGAKKIKSKLAGHLEPLNFSNIMVVRGRQFDYVGSAVSGYCFKNIKDDWEKIWAAGYVVRTVDELIKNSEPDGSDNIFSALLDFLFLLERNKFNYLLGVNLFIFKILNLLGQQPEINHCLVCARMIAPETIKFSFNRGGIICRPCYRRGEYRGEDLTLSREAVKVLRLAKQQPDMLKLIKTPIKINIDQEINNLIKLFLNY